MKKKTLGKKIVAGLTAGAKAAEKGLKQAEKYRKSIAKNKIARGIASGTAAFNANAFGISSGRKRKGGAGYSIDASNLF